MSDSRRKQRAGGSGRKITQTIKRKRLSGSSDSGDERPSPSPRPRKKRPEPTDMGDLSGVSDFEYFSHFTKPGFSGTEIHFSDLSDLPDDHSTLVDDQEFIPDQPWTKYFTPDTTQVGKAKRFNGSRKQKTLSKQQHFNFQTYTFGLGDRTEEVHLYRSTKMSQVKRLKKKFGARNFLDVETYTPQFSRGFLAGAIDSKKKVHIHDDTTLDTTFKGRTRKNAKRQVGTAVLGRETLSLLKAGYTPGFETLDLPKPRSSTKTVKQPVMTLTPPKTLSIGVEDMSSIWDMGTQNPSIQLGDTTVFATEPPKLPPPSKSIVKKGVAPTPPKRLSLSQYFQSVKPPGDHD